MKLGGPSTVNATVKHVYQEPAEVPTRCIDPSSIDPDAIKVIKRLRHFGHKAFLVGGCVRDMMLRRLPKDFDVATSARPNEIRRIFRNCRLIGRRFRLAHIHFRGKIIETATFRAGADRRNDEDLFIFSDNVFGNEYEDAYRRDFTINALYYDPLNQTIVDHVGGLEDLVNRTIRCIGPADIRVREDPVRILRAIKFAGRLGFVIERDTWQAMVMHRWDLQKCAPPRLLEEILRMLRCGGAEKCFQILWESCSMEVILPEIAHYLARSPERDEERNPGAGLFAFLQVLDQKDKNWLSNAVLLSCMLLHPILDAARNGGDCYDLEHSQAATGKVAQELLCRLVERVRLPKWEAERVQQLVVSQKRLFSLPRKGSLPRSLMRRSYFPEALDLFDIAVQASGRGRWTLKRLRVASSQNVSGVKTAKRVKKSIWSSWKNRIHL